MAGELRHRQPYGSGYDSRSTVSRSSEDVRLYRAIQTFDVYARVDDDLQVKTDAGAAVTIGFWVLTLLLVTGEVAAYLRRPPSTERVVVDSTMGQKLRINADIVGIYHSRPMDKSTVARYGSVFDVQR